MLNLPVAINKGVALRWLLLTLMVVVLAVPARVFAQGLSGIRITAPASGDVLQGLVNITGTSAADGFHASELSFAHVSDPISTWFLIYQTDSPVTDGLLAAWDTSLVTDGDYNLRLRVTLQDGSVLESLVTGLRIRNQLPTETPSPTSTPALTATPELPPLPSTPQPVPTSTPLPTPTPLPSNPASVTPSDLYTSLGRGILIALLTFLVLALFLRLRRS